MTPPTTFDEYCEAQARRREMRDGRLASDVHHDPLEVLASMELAMEYTQVVRKRGNANRLPPKLVLDLQIAIQSIIA
jgi:hypothetical protein